MGGYPKIELLGRRLQKIELLVAPRQHQTHICFLGQSRVGSVKISTCTRLVAGFESESSACNQGICVAGFEFDRPVEIGQGKRVLSQLQVNYPALINVVGIVRGQLAGSIEVGERVLEVVPGRKRLSVATEVCRVSAAACRGRRGALGSRAVRRRRAVRGELCGGRGRRGEFRGRIWTRTRLRRGRC